jgi:glycosyltransferase involved in cell wall biosynthesis
MNPSAVDRQYRTLLVTEFFPYDEKAVTGAFQRLRAHIAGLRLLGPLDVVFFCWSERDLSSAEASEREAKIRRDWSIEGKIWFVAIRGRQNPFASILNLIWACRGAVGFLSGKPTMRTSGRVQAVKLRKILHNAKPDLIFAHRLGTAAALLRAGCGPIPTILDIDDLEHVRLERTAEATDGLLGNLQLRLFARIARWVERRLVARSSCALVCSEIDRDKLRAICPGATVAVLPNTAQVFAALGPAETPTAIFIGIAAYPPNREAILWLAHDIWPRVRLGIPQARLLIVGEESQDLALMPNQLGIETLGFQPSLESTYRAARIALCPIRRGGGTRIKIIEAAINGRAVVSTTIGAEGLSFEPDREIMIADQAAGFAEKCIGLLGEGGRATSLGDAARRRAQALYAPDRVAAQLVALCLAVLRASEAPKERASKRTAADQFHKA